MIDEATATTALERSVRIRALVHDANPDYLQVLLELGARRAEELNGMATGPELGAGVLRLAADVTETFEPEVPAFEVGERVIVVDRDWSDAPRVRGRVDDRYLNERGDWEYHVHIQGGGVGPYAEADISPFNG